LPTHTTRDFLSVEPLPSYEPTIGRWLWMLEETRRETKMALANIDQSLLDWTPSPTENSIGTLLYHIGLIELDWLYVEALENAPWPEELKELFPIEDRDAQHVLSVIRHVSLDEHLRRLDTLRTHLLAAFRGMPLEEFRRPRPFPDYDVTPEWVLHHLIQHEVEHRGHIQMLRSLAEYALEAS
jgi:uncharacterized damage-inducible protein DinB